ncbi:MAG TPA: hypothetical protein PKO33_05970 [Pyrinomonadaceae bacterium]|nr:hypothetical protein [Pyrinomonadaceae bacterium]
MRSAIISTIVFLTATGLLACGGGGETPNANTTKPNANAPVNKLAENSNLAVVTKTPEPIANEAATLAPVFKSLCEAMAKKDEAAVRKAYSAAALKDFEADMKEEGEKSLVAYLETEQLSDCQIGGEKIEGDRGSALIKTKGAPNGTRMKFVKENGEWKLTGETEDFDAVKKSAGSK